MTSTLLDPQTTTLDQTTVAIYANHADAEVAVRRLVAAGLPIKELSIIGRHFETHEEITGFYRPADAALTGAGQGAWFGGLFGLMMGAFGFFILPVVGGIMAIGPLAGFIAGAIGGAGIGALVDGLIAMGVPRDQALKYQERIQAGEFLVVVQGSAGEMERAHEVLRGTTQTHLQAHPVTHTPQN